MNTESIDWIYENILVIGRFIVNLPLKINFSFPDSIGLHNSACSALYDGVSATLTEPPLTWPDESSSLSTLAASDSSESGFLLWTSKFQDFFGTTSSSFKPYPKHSALTSCLANSSVSMFWTTFSANFPKFQLSIIFVLSTTCFPLDRSIVHFMWKWKSFRGLNEDSNDR